MRRDARSVLAAAMVSLAQPAVSPAGAEENKKQPQPCNLRQFHECSSEGFN